ncbi:MAG: hypothetical protein MZV63_65035 [Marinilabiliales bacterium]|nr:hypothetical protein [Marinilabiliales bacterium]
MFDRHEPDRRPFGQRHLGPDPHRGLPHQALRPGGEQGRPGVPAGLCAGQGRAADRSRRRRAASIINDKHYTPPGAEVRERRQEPADPRRRDLGRDVDEGRGQGRARRRLRRRGRLPGLASGSSSRSRPKGASSRRASAPSTASSSGSSSDPRTRHPSSGNTGSRK